MEMILTCTKCGHEGSAADFHAAKRKKSGFSSWCKSCTKRVGEFLRERNRQTNQDGPAPITKKKCTKCGVVKPPTTFHRHSGTRDGYTSHCNDCCSTPKIKAQKRERMNRRYESHSEEIKATARDSYQRNRERALSQKRNKCREDVEYRAQRAAYNSDYQRTVILASPERRERHRAACRAWEKGKGREKLRASNQNRRARSKSLPGSFTSQEWLALCERYENRCLRCGTTNDLTADHIIPTVCPGATNFIENIQPLCGKCNSSKGVKIVDYRPDKSCLL